MSEYIATYRVQVTRSFQGAEVSDARDRAVRYLDNLRAIYPEAELHSVVRTDVSVEHYTPGSPNTPKFPRGGPPGGGTPGLGTAAVEVPVDAIAGAA